MELCETGTNNDLETVGIVKTNCKTVGEFLDIVYEKWSLRNRPKIRVNGKYIKEIEKDINYEKIENIRFVDGWGGLEFLIKTKIDFTMNEKNLIPINQRTKDEQREIAQKGGIASGEARREKKRLTDVLRSILNEDSDNPEYKTKLEEIVGKTLKNLTKDPNIYELRTLQEMLGEYVQKVETTDTTPPEEKLKKMMKDAGLC